jgi:hypothetical protein
LSESTIRVEEMNVEGSKVTYRISCDGEVRRFLAKDSFYLKTDHPLDTVPPGITVIPLLGCLVPLSWITDSRIIVGAVDEVFFASILRVREAMRLAYPILRFLGSVEATPTKTVSNWDPEKYGLLYSGGVDSLASLVRNRAKKPQPLMVRGTPDLRIEERKFFDRSFDRLAPAVRDLGGEIHVIETDALNTLDYSALQSSVRNAEEIRGWWQNFAHGLFLTGMTAPVTYLAHIGQLLIASSFHSENPKPWGSMPGSDEQIRWGGLLVIHDSFDLQRFEKVRTIIAPFIRESGREGFPIRVCTGDSEVRLASGELNCGRCGKCMRTMLMLLENGIDPAACGFDTSRFFPNRIKIGLENGYIKLAEAPGSWARILDHASEVPPALISRYPGMDRFAAWADSWNRCPKETRLRSYSKKLAPVGSRRRRAARKVFRSD